MRLPTLTLPALILATCASCTCAFLPHISHSISSKKNADTIPYAVSHANRNSNSDNIREKTNTNTNHQIDIDIDINPTINMNRRDMFTAMIGSSLAIAAGTFLPPPSLAKEGYLPDMAGGGLVKAKGVGGLPKKIRAVSNIMDELQRDLMQERWDLVEKYPDQLRSFVPLFTTFTDAAFPSDEPTDNGLRVALRYEVGRFFAGVERMKQATARRNLDEAYVAYSEMSLHFDRYLHVGGLYTYYDATVTNEDYFKNVASEALVHSDPKKDPAEVRDLIVLTKGTDMGKTGIVIGIYPDGSNKCIVKLDRFKGLREIRVVPRDVVAKRLGEQAPDDVFLIPRKNGNGNSKKS